MSKTIIYNIGTIVTGDYINPVAEGDTICTDGDKIIFVGWRAEAPKIDYTVDINAVELTVCPGLIDANTHPPLANYLPAYKAYDWVDNYAGAGITSMVSTGSFAFPGAAADVSSAKAQAIFGKYMWDHYHPSFVKVHDESVMLQQGMTEADFAELAAAGIHIIGEIGLSAVKAPSEAARLAGLAKKHGFTVTLHAAAPISADGVAYTLDEIKQINPDVLCCLNGDPTPLKEEWIKQLVQSGQYWFDCVSNGNETLLIKIAAWAKEAGTLGKMMLGTNVPSMSGFSPMGLWLQMAALAQDAEVDPAVAVAMGSGNVARCYGLDHGILAPGMVADFMFTSTGSIMPDMLSTISYGRVPSVAGTFINGEAGLANCKNMAPPKKRPVITSLT